MKVLLVDDMVAMRKVIGKFLNELGYTDIIEADDGGPALELFNEEEVDLVISDWNMPDMTGLDLLREIRSGPKNPKVPFIMLTSEAEKAQVVTAIKHGASNYIVKPATKEMIEAKINETLNA